MDDLPESLFLDPIRAALQTSHRHLALQLGGAIRYRADVAPFAALIAPTAESLRDLHTLLSPTETIWVAELDGLDLAAARLVSEGALDCPQMILPKTVALPERGTGMFSLSVTDAPEMVALTDVAFPGFFRPRGMEMGAYFGIRAGGELVAMGGERFKTPGYCEISALCTHPAHRGKGYGARIAGEIARSHRRENVVSWLHVAAANQPAIDLYHKLGFVTVRTIRLYRVSIADERGLLRQGL